MTNLFPLYYIHVLVHFAICTHVAAFIVYDVHDARACMYASVATFLKSGGVCIDLQTGSTLITPRSTCSINWHFDVAVQNQLDI